mgnify:CR=1 FL=1
MAKCLLRKHLVHLFLFQEVLYNDQNFQLKFTASETLTNTNNGGDTIKSSDINFSIP